jgi:hypothetical protein
MADSRWDWNSSPHPISDLRDWNKTERLILRPPYQRGYVWPHAARISLIDTILRNIPMPKFLISAELNKNQMTVRSVVDGQQRASAILHFLRDDFALQSPPCEPQFDGKKFSDLPEEVQLLILQYRLDFNEIRRASDAEVREIYTRLNKYSMPLSTQELRRAEYMNSKFLLTAESLCKVYDDVDEEDNQEELGGDNAECGEAVAGKFFTDAGVFTFADRRRMRDVEFISELLAGLLDGPQDKKESIDSFYVAFAEWPEEQRRQTIGRLVAVLECLSKTLGRIGDLPFKRTRFRQRSDFYSLFFAVDGILCAGGTIAGKNLQPLIEDFDILQEKIAPTSKVPSLQEYAVRCVSDANSRSSRMGRIGFIAGFLKGTLLSQLPSEAEARVFVEILYSFESDDCPPTPCRACSQPLFGHQRIAVCWWEDCREYQYSNASYLHEDCCDVAVPHVVVSARGA